jgi:hypothetical protein
MELRDVWYWYCQQRFPEEKELPPPQPVSPWEGLELLFDLHPMFTARSDIVSSVEYDTVFDDEVDGALCKLAVVDDFGSWDEMTAGGWRVMSERLLWSETVIAANAASDVDVIAHLPAGLNRQSSARALMLMYLLGGGRTIDPRVLDKRRDGTFPGFPADRPIRRQ